jgi:hypothetical protein
MLGKVISGGQTGVDRAALDVALELGLPTGGWCPKGRRAEDGRIPDRYPMRETESAAYRIRTRKNIEDSHATLILAWGPATGGTRLTIETCKRTRKRHWVVDLTGENLADAVEPTRLWLSTLDGKVLNVAGPRGEAHPEVYARAREFLTAVLTNPTPN